MTDLSRVLPNFSVAQHAHLLQVLERHHVTTTDLLTLDVADIGKRTQLPLLDVKRLTDAVVHALHHDLGVRGSSQRHEAQAEAESESAFQAQQTRAPLRRSLADLTDQTSPPSFISTLDDTLDRALGGGIPTGYVTEITGESGAGKTQFLLSLLLSVQLPAPHGLGRPALYISTEATLSTVRLSQILKNHPRLPPLAPSRNDARNRNLLDGILSTVTPDLESQEHILQFQVPVMVERHNVGLIVLDSVATNYRAEFERGGSRSGNGGGGSRGSNMAARSHELVRLGALLRGLAQKHDLAVAVANQVADRFSSPHDVPPPPSSRGWGPIPPRSSNSSSHNVPATGPFAGASQDGSPLIARSKNKGLLPLHGQGPQAQVQAQGSSTLDTAAEPPSSSVGMGAADMPPPPRSSNMPMEPPHPSFFEDPALASGQSSLPGLALDHQQRWFTGWGDDPFADYGLKTPSLGLVWTTQVACRIALLKRPVYGVHRYGGGRLEGDGDERGGGGGDCGDDNDYERGLLTPRNWRRWMKVVFAPHVAATGQGLEGAAEFEVTMGGLKALEGKV